MLSSTRKGVRTYRCRSSFSKTRRLATGRAGAGQASRTRAHDSRVEAARSDSTNLRSRGRIGARRRAWQLSHRDSACLRSSARCVGARRVSRVATDARSGRGLHCDSPGGERRGRQDSHPTASGPQRRDDGGRVARHDRRLGVSRDRTPSLRRSAVCSSRESRPAGWKHFAVERQRPNRGAWWRRVQAGRRGPVERADSLSAQLRQSG